MKSSNAQRWIAKRSIMIAGHKTSVSLEDEFWKALREIAALRDTTPSELITAIDADRKYGNLSSALRLFVLRSYQEQIADLGVALPATQRSPRSAVRHGRH